MPALKFSYRNTCPLNLSSSQLQITSASLLEIASIFSNQITCLAIVLFAKFQRETRRTFYIYCTNMEIRSSPCAGLLARKFRYWHPSHRPGRVINQPLKLTLARSQSILKGSDVKVPSCSQVEKLSYRKPDKLLCRENLNSKLVVNGLEKQQRIFSAYII